MARWLFKEEPESYSFTDLLSDGETTWEGVSNALALKHLRAVRADDEVFYYHTGKEKAVVGVMHVASAAEQDGLPVVKVTPVRKLAYPVTLAAIKADPLFADWELVRQSRLSVMPVPTALWKRVEQLAKNPPEQGKAKKKAAG
jgi:predicted RNA-binding protein with PUA-like domain